MLASQGAHTAPASPRKKGSVTPRIGLSSSSFRVVFSGFTRVHPWWVCRHMSAKTKRDAFNALILLFVFGNEIEL